MYDLINFLYDLLLLMVRAMCCMIRLFVDKLVAIALRAKWYWMNINIHSYHLMFPCPHGADWQRWPSWVIKSCPSTHATGDLRLLIRSTAHDMSLSLWTSVLRYGKKNEHYPKVHLYWKRPFLNHDLYAHHKNFTAYSHMFISPVTFMGTVRINLNQMIRGPGDVFVV